jgi:hypothetical protein
MPIKYKIDPTTGDNALDKNGDFIEDKTPSAMETVFPRSFNAAENDKGIGRKLLAAGGDALSAILRVPAAVGRMADTRMGSAGDHPQGFAESLNQINQGQDPTGQPSIITNAVRDPATVATAGVPIVKGAQGLGLLGKILMGGGQGAAIGAVNAGIHEAEKDDGTPVDWKQAGVETGTNAALGATLPILGKLLETGGKKIINTIVRPSSKIEKFGYGAAGRDAEQVGNNTADAIFANKLDANSLPAMAKKVQAAKTATGSQMNAVLQSGQAAGNKVDPYDVVDQVIADISANPEKFEAPLAGMNDAKGQILDEINQFHELKKVAPGEMGLEDIRKLKTHIGGMGKWSGEEQMTAKQALANAVNRKLDAAIDDAAPGIEPLNNLYQQLKSIGKVLEDRAPVHNRNNLIGIPSLTALAAGGPEGLAAQLASKSPAVARGMYYTGRNIQQPMDLLKFLNITKNGLVNQGQ